MGHFNATPTLDGILVRVLNGRDAYRKITISPIACDVGDSIACPRCGEIVTVTEYTSSFGKTVRYWSGCMCLGDAAATSERLTAASVGYQAAAHGDIGGDMRSLIDFTFTTFDCSRLDGGAKLVAAARRWLELISPLSVAESYHADPRPCLYFYSAGKGRGKTHLAGALLNEARKAGRLVAFADEISYIERYWAAPHEAKEQLSALPGERAWLTVLDDLGQRESTGAGLRDAWYDILNPRWLKRGWTVITSNWTPDELVQRGTINEATYSRMVQMTRGQLVHFDGRDQRLGEAQ